MRSVFDFVAAFTTVLGSSIQNQTKALFVDVSGIGSIDLDDPLGDDDTGEVGVNSEAFGALGVLSRPLDPETVGGKDFATDVLAMRTSDGLVPVAWRDLRLNEAFPDGIPKGRISLVGYGGGFHAIDLSDNGYSIHTIYASYANGTKAMAITLDTDTETISFSVGEGPPANDGYQVSLNQADGLQVRTPSSNTFFNVSEDEISLVAPKVTIQAGQVMLGSFLTTPTPYVNAFPIGYIPTLGATIPVPSLGVFVGEGIG